MTSTACYTLLSSHRLITKARSLSVVSRNFHYELHWRSNIAMPKTADGIPSLVSLSPAAVPASVSDLASEIVLFSVTLVMISMRIFFAFLVAT